MLLQSKFCWDLSICNSLTCHWSPHIGGDVRRRSCAICLAFSGYALSKDSSVLFGPCSQSPQTFREHPVNWQCPGFISLPEWDFTCGCSTSSIGAVCGRTLQLQWLELKTRPTSVHHLMLGHICGCVSTEVEVKWYYSCLSWKFPVGCFTANWKLLSTDSLCSCLGYRESACLRADLPKRLTTSTSFWSVNLSAVASTKKGWTLVAGNRWGNTEPSLPFRGRTCSTLGWNQSRFPKAFCKTCLCFVF